MPLGYLLLMVPLPYLVYDAVAFPLKQLVTGISVACLNGMGVVVLREGNILLFPNVTLEVADACSGIRSLTSLVALSIAFAWAAGTTPWRRWAIAASAVPLAIGTNALRVVLTGLLAQHWGGEAARGFFHESAGLAVFAAGTVLLAAFGMLLRGKS